MVYNELRKDYLLNRWVVIATERSRRPTDFAKQKTVSEQNGVCPLCVGNEHMTPPAVMLYLNHNGEIEKSRDHNGAKTGLSASFQTFIPPSRRQKTQQTKHR
jgi:galactose-1-phosphate uridylyltransferase